MQGIASWSALCSLAACSLSHSRLNSSLHELYYLCKMPPSSTKKLDAVLMATIGCLTTVGNIVQIAPVPYAEQVISLALSILTTIQRVRDNKTAFQQLADDIQALVCAVLDARVLSVAMERILEGLVSVLLEIEDFALEHTSHNIFHRMVTSSMDASRIQDYRSKVQQALVIFGVKTQIGTHENTVLILRLLLELRESVGPRQVDGLVPSDPTHLSKRHHNLDAVLPHPGISPPSALSPAPSIQRKDGPPDLRRYFSDSELSGLTADPRRQCLGVDPVTAPYQTSTPRGMDSRPAITSMPARGQLAQGPPDLPPLYSDFKPLCSAGPSGDQRNSESAPAPYETSSPKTINPLFSSPTPSTLVATAGAVTGTSDPKFASNTSKIPEDFRENIEKNSRLCSILGVTIAFQETPSVHQISRILGLQWTDVGTALKPFRSHFDGLDATINYNSNVRLQQLPKEEVLQMVGPSEKYHSLLAQWCLVGPTPDARDIFYASEFWDYHVRNANPSTELYIALRSSRRPLSPTSRSKLPAVIEWLEKNGEREAVDLSLLYRGHGSRPSQPVEIMGGMLSILFK
ncbi:hypothetical protein MVEN_01574000 [Mycena venus]|uniref:Uncharacterized protein n=1 Tax=Mycena venus TaxID=2733690 RepID=A0A8H7CS77_9AGAR|nr:hypothetical protein MVEN_01574000 [Mycena venus]